VDGHGGPVSGAGGRGVRWVAKGRLAFGPNSAPGTVVLSRWDRAGRIASFDIASGSRIWGAFAEPGATVEVHALGHTWLLAAQRRFVQTVEDITGRVRSFPPSSFLPAPLVESPALASMVVWGSGALHHLRPGEPPERQAHYFPMHLPSTSPRMLLAVGLDGCALLGDASGRLLRLDPSAPLEPLRRAHPGSVAWEGHRAAAVLQAAAQGEHLYLRLLERDLSAWLVCLEPEG
jgi:hypothetical protein